MSYVPPEPARSRRHRSVDVVRIAYRTDVTSMNRKRDVPLADLTASEREELLKALARTRPPPAGRRAYSSVTVTLGAVSFAADPELAPELLAFAKRMLGGEDAFGNDPGW